VAALEPRYPVESDRLLFRPFTGDDFAALFAIHSRADVARYLYWEPRTHDELDALLKEKSSHTSITAEDDTLALATVLKETMELHRRLQSEVAQSRASTGGSASSSIPTITDTGMRPMRDGCCCVLPSRISNCIGSSADSSNGTPHRRGCSRSWGCVGKLSSVRTSTSRGEWQSEVVYAILHEEWDPS
jgi:hypothetical protein